MKRIVVYNKIDLANTKRSTEMIKALEMTEKDPQVIAHLPMSTKENINMSKLLKTLGENCPTQF